MCTQFYDQGKFTQVKLGISSTQIEGLRHAFGRKELPAGVL
jgi:hypothetical protein